MKALLLAAVRVALGLVFVYAASTKLADMRQFAEEIANYQVLAPSLVPFAAVLLLGVELTAGTLLVAGAATRAAALTVAGMLAAFIVALSQALLRGVDLRCGCFGGSDLASWSTVLRDVVLLAAALAVLLGSPAVDDEALSPAHD
jgi:putative oxidoreductase